jgi:hypothetical protein
MVNNYLSTESGISGGPSTYHANSANIALTQDTNMSINII